MKTATASVLTEQQAIELSNEYFRLEAVINKIKEQLKEYVKENGELIAGDVVWKFQNYESWEFKDSEKTKDFLKSLVIDGYTADPFSLVTVNKTQINKLGLEENYLQHFATKKVSSRFVNRKK